MVGSTDLKAPTDELTWVARFAPPIVRSDRAHTTGSGRRFGCGGRRQLRNLFTGLAVEGIPGKSTQYDRFVSRC
jgi:hypothetical protein